jgi:hypothetical protein
MTTDAESVSPIPSQMERDCKVRSCAKRQKGRVGRLAGHGTLALCGAWHCMIGKWMREGLSPLQTGAFSAYKMRDTGPHSPPLVRGFLLPTCAPPHHPHMQRSFDRQHQCLTRSGPKWVHYLAMCRTANSRCPFLAMNTPFLSDVSIL